MAEHQYTQQPKKTENTSRKQTISTKQIPTSHPAAIIQRARINPKSLTHADVMQLQRTIGNRAVGMLLSEIGLIHSTAKLVQRQEIPEEEEPLQGKFEDKPEQATCPSCMQRREIPEEKELLKGMMIETIQHQEISEEEEPLQTKRENNTGMPDNLKAGVENLSGIDMSDVRVHYDSNKPAEIGALAYTQGTNIYVSPGQEKHLPHETWHVVQQVQKRVIPNVQMKEIAINDDVDLEREANVMGEKAVQDKKNKTMMHSASRAFEEASGASKNLPSIQMKRIIESKEQYFDRFGGHISQGQTAAQNLVNNLNHYPALKDASKEEYKNAHMLAATFGGVNEVANEVAWINSMEENWTTSEREIRGQSSNECRMKPRPNEIGTVTININLPQDKTAEGLAELIFDKAEDQVANPANWYLIPGNPHPAPLTEDDIRFSTNKQGEKLLRSVFTARVVHEIDQAVNQMPDFAKITYASDSPDNKRKWSYSCDDKSLIADLEVGDEGACLKQISSMDVLPAVNGHKLRNNL